MEEISYNPKWSIIPARHEKENRYYVVTHPVRFYTSGRQTLFTVERGYHIDTSLIPPVIRKRLLPNGPLGVIAAVFCKLMENRTLFDELQQKTINVDDVMAYYLLAAVTEQFARSRWEYHLITKTFNFALALKTHEGISASEERIEAERNWRRDNPPAFVSAK